MSQTTSDTNLVPQWNSAEDKTLFPSVQKKAAETRRRRREERETLAWLGRLTMLIDESPHDYTSYFFNLDIIDGNVEAALDQGIAEILSAMAPLTPEQIADELRDGVEHPRPLVHDVALAHGGKILAVIQPSADGPIVTRLRATDAGRPSDPR